MIRLRKEMIRHRKVAQEVVQIPRGQQVLQVPRVQSKLLVVQYRKLEELRAITSGEIQPILRTLEQLY